MTVDISRAPFPVRYRELWLPRGINENASLPSSRYDGHPLALTGARKGTTCEGVHFTGAATSNINCGAIHNAAAKLWVSFRFKLDQPFSSAVATDQYIWGKWLDGDNYITLYLDSTDGRLYFKLRTLTVTRFSIPALDAGGQISSWEAGRWYHALCSISDVNGARFLLDNYPNTDADLNAAPNGGELIFGDLDDPGAGLGFEGIEVDIFIGTDDLTANEELSLSNGIPPWAPADVVNEYPLDEGRGTIAYDRGTGGNNGTLDTAATWAWGECRQPVISFDGQNDLAQSSVGVDISGAVTMVWAGKLKARYGSVITDHEIFEYFLDNTNYYALMFNPLINDFRFLCVVGGTNPYADTHGFAPEIDDYCIFIATVTNGGAVSLFTNGVLDEVDTGLAPIAAGGVTAYIGAEDTPAYYDVSKPLMVALIEGAFSQAQVLEYSRFLDKVFNMGVVT